nr:probable lysine-specific demethylase ELF6 [Ipomoea batatas]
MKNVEMAQWLKGLPLAPEFRPTDTEFSDPIAYISKIEREASAFGICKVIPPFPKPSKKYVLHNLNKSLSKSPELGSDVKVSTSSKMSDGDKGNGDRGEVRAFFTTRRQELGRSEKKKMKGMAGSQPFGAQKQVWQSGEVYTLDQFEAKSKAFARNQLGTAKDVSPLAVEAMFWKAVSQEPVCVEYANDVPGSGFGEPQGVSNIYRKKRRRRKRAVFDRNNTRTCDSKNEVDILDSDNIDKDSCCASPNLCTESPSACSTSSQQSQISSVPGPKGLSDSNDVEGTAGWKLANSAWNLQVIARSPGSITRYMPDDIPGVTSPMVYVGMLFSWFAWHVEDHELHSLNFLHMGSPKTWYAVPGDYAFKFEEVIRVHAYGDSTDRLAALTLLGEKTTLLSPEVIVSSGIPCCRLVQYPGEFVVTFPRAYHIGFSHGFNCGEAANFGTPEWLTVAKDAAVRRAAMNYLPMLSHQQLLYLLTMSFVSRVPKSLLPGVRSSRLRDRQKEERETLVKKAFVQDVIKENELVTILLQKNSSYQTVLWDVNMLPSSTKEFELQKRVGVDVKTTKGSEQTENYDSQDLLSQMNSYMESLSDFCVDDDDLSNDFHIDSGALPCIACGILGFPFMAVVEPSEKAAKNFFLEDCHTMQNIGDLKDVESHSHSLQDDIVEGNGAVDRSMPHKRFVLHSQDMCSRADSRPSSISHMEDQPPLDGHSISPRNVAVNLEGKQDVYKKFLRPHVFCLEHAIQTEELLRSRGGAKVLIICHSDFQKIRAYAACIAEEMDAASVYNEIPLDNASDEHLRFIDLAIEDGNSECVEDWTSKLCINLLHSVKLCRNYPAKKLQYALILSRLFPETTLSTKCLSFKWESRKVRSKRKLNCQAESKPSMPLKTEEQKGLGAKLDVQTVRERNIIIQYTRKRYKLKPCASTDVSKAFVESNTVIPHEISNADEKARCESESTPIRNGCAGATSKEMPELLLECQTLTIEDQNETSHSKHSPVVTTEVVENPLAHPKDSKSEKPDMDLPDPEIESNKMPLLNEVNDVESSVHIERVNFEASACSVVTAVCSAEVSESLKQPDCTEISITEKAIDLPRMHVSERGRDCNIQTDGFVTGVYVPTNSSGSCSDCPSEQRSDELAEQIAEGQVGSGVEASDFTKFHKKIGHEIQSVQDLDDANHLVVRPSSTANVGGKRRRELDMLIGNGGRNAGVFVKSPCEGLRPRARKDDTSGCTGDSKITVDEKPSARKPRNCSEKSSTCKDKKEQTKGSHRCDFEGCRMSFQTKTELSLHKRNRCPVDGCGKKFNSHKYALLHQRVHEDDRPLKCPWKGCTMSFKWAWARTEHLRVHTGERPYKCKVEGCGLTFRFVSDFSRHRRKTGHHSSR